MNGKLFAISLFAASTLSIAAEVPIRKSGGMLVDGNGMTLYTYDKDSTDKSACGGPCAAAWPPLKAPANAKAQSDFTVAEREDGSKQWAYKGKPLYTYAKDKAPGDKTGDGANGTWRIAK